MNILICPDKFKSSLSAFEVSNAIKSGILQYTPEVEIQMHPLADGGDGSIDVLSHFLPLQEVSTETIDPLGRNITTTYFRENKTAYIELAKAAGIDLLKKDEHHPLSTSTIGTGYQIRHALSSGCDKIYLFIGGSATTDAGMGIAHAMGIRFYDKENNILDPIGANLMHVYNIDKSGLILEVHQTKIIILCDVENVLYGVQGAAYVYGPQKGANPYEVKELDNGLQNFAKVIQTQFDIDISTIIGGGAAGGTAAGLVGLIGATIHKGIDTIMSLTHFEQKVEKADFVISGEGKIDNQTLYGKTIAGVSHLCEKYNKPLFLFCGVNQLTVSEATHLYHSGIMSIMEYTGGDNSEAMSYAKKYLQKMGYDWAIKNL